MNDEAQKWLNYPKLDDDLRKEIEKSDDAELNDMFYDDLAFGTGGMRGIMGAGTNRFNVYTLRRANQGFADYLKSLYDGETLKKRGVVIAHDNRRNSRFFAKESAQLLAKNGIICYLFDDLRPTPELSFAVRHLNAAGGIMVTASHNPPEYNGYKIYDDSGCQLTPDKADQVIDYVNAIDDVFSLEILGYDDMVNQGLMRIIGDDIDKAYLDLVKSIRLHPDVDKHPTIVFTPLHGTSATIGLRLLKETGYDVHAVKEQFLPDPDFSTVESPNPENEAAFTMAIELGKKIGAEMLIATDPDADRLGIAIKTNNGYKLLNGNQTGAVLLYYLLGEGNKLGTLPKNGVVFNTIVTSELGAEIARDFGYEVKSTLTGFKFIGEQARLLEDTDQSFIFGYEESFGYLIDDGVRDKDALQAMLLASEALCFYASQDRSIDDVLKEIYERYGYYHEDLISIMHKGIEGKKTIARIMKYFRNNPPKEVAGKKITVFEDYKKQERIVAFKDTEPLELPQSNVLKFFLEDDFWFVLRPSGTEPKLKLYIGGKADDKASVYHGVDAITNDVREKIKAIEEGAQDD